MKVDSQVLESAVSSETVSTSSDSIEGVTPEKVTTSTDEVSKEEL